MSHSGHSLSQDSNPGLCGAWIVFSMERVGDGEHGGAGRGPQGGKEGWEVSPPLSSTSLTPPFLFPSPWTPVSVFDRLSLCLPPCSGGVRVQTAGCGEERTEKLEPEPAADPAWAPGSWSQPPDLRVEKAPGSVSEDPGWNPNFVLSPLCGLVHLALLFVKWDY